MPIFLQQEITSKNRSFFHLGLQCYKFGLGFHNWGCSQLKFLQIRRFFSSDSAPGIYSARWTEDEQGNRNWALGMERVYEALKERSGQEKANQEGANDVKTARFICALSLALPDGSLQSFEGKVEGKIVWPARGDKGFGYDPIFEPLGHDITFGQMEPEAKHAMSHRADAFAQLLAALKAKLPRA